MRNLQLALRAASFYVLFIVMSAGVLVLFIIGRLLMPAWLKYRGGGLWSRCALWLVENVLDIHVRLKGADNIPSGPVVLLSSHQSALETIAMPYLVPHATFLLKRELLWIPIFGWGLAMVPVIAINRSRGSTSLKQLLRKGGRLLQDGHRVIVFPEGTRSLPDQQLPFKSGGAALAVRSKVPAVPVALDSGRLWPRNSFLKQPGTVTVSFGPPLLGSQAEVITEKAHQWIQQESTALLKPI